jgi:diguanylate cyclase (GGDEF)-like protein
MNRDSQKMAANAHKHRVLVVDNDRVQRLKACAALQTLGLDVCEAGSGKQALELLARERFDAVLLDIRMPLMDGVETCRRIRALQRGECLPVIMATGIGDMEALEAAYHVGATDFVVKPINWTILKHRIRYNIAAHSLAKDLPATTSHPHRFLKSIPEAVLSLDRDGRMVEVRSPNVDPVAGEYLFQVGDSLPATLPTAAAVLAKTAIRAIQQGQHQTNFEFAIDTDGAELSYEVFLAPAGSSDMVALVLDSTERRHAEATIRRLAYFDGVTGLPNREMMQQYIDDKLRKGAAAGGSVALFRLELCGLDYARRLLGCQRSDELLRMCADRLQQMVASSGVTANCASRLVGRVSDAGLAVVLDGVLEKKLLRRFAERIHANMASTYMLGDLEINITTRLGIAAQKKQPAADVVDLFDRAETAVAQSRSAPAFYSRKAGKKRRDRARLMKELQSAVNNGDLHLEYQPKVNSADLALCGVEALARWNHASRGPISPGVFIPLAEENGLILPVGEFVLEEASRQSRQWSRADLKVVPIAVNFSGHQFSKKGLLENVISTLAGYSISEGEIEIELTETVAMDQYVGIGQVLQELNDIGIRTAIDDFGIGHSSLNNLRQYQFHTLKIDRSFVADLDRNPSARSLIRGIVSMGHALNMQVVAEGVEQDNQLDFLREQVVT